MPHAYIKSPGDSWPQVQLLEFNLILQTHWKIYLQSSNRQEFARDSRKTVVGPPSFSILSRSGQKFQQETATGRSCWFLERSPGHGRSVVNLSCHPPWHMRTSPAWVLRNPELAAGITTTKRFKISRGRRWWNHLPLWELGLREYKQVLRWVLANLWKKIQDADFSGSWEQ